MSQEMKKNDYILLLPTLIPIFVLFVIPLFYSLSLVFSTPSLDKNGEKIFESDTNFYHYNVDTNRYDEQNKKSLINTGVKLKPYAIKSNKKKYQEIKKYGLENFKIFFTQHKYLVTIKNTLLLVLPVSICQFILSFLFAYYCRGKIKGKFLYTTLIIFPLTLGSLIVAAGITNFFRSAGWFNMFIMWLGVVDSPIKVLYTYWGTFIAVLISGTAFLFSGFLAICEGIDPNLELAGQTLGANKFTSFYKIFLPIAIPSLLSIFGLNIVLTLGLYPSAVLVGDPVGSTRVFAVAAFEEFQQDFNFNMAATISFILTLCQIAILIIIGRVRKLFYIGYGGSFK